MRDEQSKRKTNLYLTGFMGTGKTSIGRELAKALRYRFVDSDRWIEKESGMKIPEIFASKGEDWFRTQERRFVDDGHPPEGCVVACGGGLITVEETRRVLEAKGILVALFASPETVLLRTSRNRNRPLLHSEDPEQRIRELMAARDPIYRSVRFAVSTDGRSFGDVRDAILRIYQTNTK